MINMSS